MPASTPAGKALNGKAHLEGNVSLYEGMAVVPRGLLSRDGLG